MKKNLPTATKRNSAMKVLSAEQMKVVDKQTIQEEGFLSIDLMERASTAVVRQLNKDFDTSQTSFVILCGIGNNGGDGLAIARLLTEQGTDVTIFLQQHQQYSSDNIINQQRCAEHGIMIRSFHIDERLFISPNAIVIDALFGYGLSRPLSADWAFFIDSINTLPNTVVAIDMPSGLQADQYTDTQSPIIKADYTYTFQSPKLALLQPANGEYIGIVTVLDINLSPIAIAQQHSSYHYITIDYVKQSIRKPSHFSHKGTFGHALILGGSFGKMGAMVLSSKAALRAGCGLVSCYIPRCGYTVLQTAFPEAMLMTDDKERTLSIPPENLSTYTALGVCIGMGTSIEAQGFLHSLLASIGQLINKPSLVLDADALNILSFHPDWLTLLPEGSILTPHPKELERLIGPWTDDFNKLQKVRVFASKYKSIVLIKGANSAIVLPHGDIYFNSTGNWGMATAGSGDTLTGILTSLLAQKYTPEQATILGVFLHGLAGDLAIQQIHPHSLIASDIIAYTSSAWRYLYNQNCTR